MNNRSIDMIFETSGQPVPTEEEVQFEAQKNEPNGKKTMLAWYWKVCGAEYDQAHA